MGGHLTLLTVPGYTPRPPLPSVCCGRAPDAPHCAGIHTAQDKEAILASTQRWFEQHNPNDMALWEEALEGWHATYAMFLKRDGEAFRAFLADAGLPVRSVTTNKGKVSRA